MALSSFVKPLKRTWKKPWNPGWKGSKNKRPSSNKKFPIWSLLSNTWLRKGKQSFENIFANNSAIDTWLETLFEEKKMAENFVVHFLTGLVIFFAVIHCCYRCWNEKKRLDEKYNYQKEVTKPQKPKSHQVWKAHSSYVCCIFHFDHSIPKRRFSFQGASFFSPLHVTLADAPMRKLLWKQNLTPIICTNESALPADFNKISILVKTFCLNLFVHVRHINDIIKVDFRP